MQLCCHGCPAISTFHELLEDRASFQHARRRHLWPITARPLRNFFLQGPQTSLFCDGEDAREGEISTVLDSCFAILQKMAREVQRLDRFSQQLWESVGPRLDQVSRLRCDMDRDVARRVISRKHCSKLQCAVLLCLCLKLLCECATGSSRARRASEPKERRSEKPLCMRTA